LILTAADGTKRTHLKPPNGCSLPLRQGEGDKDVHRKKIRI